MNSYIDGIWDHVTLAIMDAPVVHEELNGRPAEWGYPKHWDVLLKQMVSRSPRPGEGMPDSRTLFGQRYGYAKAKRQLSTAALRRYAVRRDMPAGIETTIPIESMAGFPVGDARRPVPGHPYHRIAPASRANRQQPHRRHRKPVTKRSHDRCGTPGKRAHEHHGDQAGWMRRREGDRDRSGKRLTDQDKWFVGRQRIADQRFKLGITQTTIDRIAHDRRFDGRTKSGDEVSKEEATAVHAG